MDGGGGGGGEEPAQQEEEHAGDVQCHQGASADATYGAF